MRFFYAYKTSDGVRHEDSVEAGSREAAFAALRAKGVKPIKVVASDGSRANGEPRRSWRAFAWAAAAAIGAWALAWALARGASGPVAPSGPVGTEAPPETVSAAGARFAVQPLPRQAIPGDRNRVEAARTGAFASRAERYLARFAEPGRICKAAEGDVPGPGELTASLKTGIMASANDFTETIDMKRMVARLKDELRRYLAAGGDEAGFMAALEERQAEEAAQREKAATQLAEALRVKEGEEAAYEIWVRANARLRSMGIHPLDLPEELRSVEGW